MSTALTFDPELAYPSYDRPFLESWNGRFEAVLVVLHPFFKLPDVQPVQQGYVVTPHARSVSGQVAFKDASKRFVDEPNPALAKVFRSSALLASIGQPDGVEWIETAQRLTWEEVADQAELGSALRVGAALSAVIGGLRKEFVVQSDVEHLISFSEQKNVFLPSEGSFQPILLSPLADLFALSGTTILYQSEFDSDPVQTLTADDLKAGLPWRGALYDPAKTHLAVIDWDSHFMLVAGPRADLE
ncbi:MAG: DUF2711 family protein, partial [Brevundimonas sp.]